MYKNPDIKYKCVEDIYFTTKESLEIAFKKGEEYEVFFDDEGNDYLIANGCKCKFSYYNREFRKHFELIILEKKEN